MKAVYIQAIYLSFNANNLINNTSILGNCSAIQSVQLAPFLDKNDLSLKQIKYDVDRFGDESNFKQVLDDDGSINVLRIDSITNTHKTLNTFKCYTPQKDIVLNQPVWLKQTKFWHRHFGIVRPIYPPNQYLKFLKSRGNFQFHASTKADRLDLPPKKRQGSIRLWPHRQKPSNQPAPPPKSKHVYAFIPPCKKKEFR